MPEEPDNPFSRQRPKPRLEDRYGVPIVAAATVGALMGTPMIATRHDIPVRPVVALSDVTCEVGDDKTVVKGRVSGGRSDHQLHVKVGETPVESTEVSADKIGVVVIPNEVSEEAKVEVEGRADTHWGFQYSAPETPACEAAPELPVPPPPVERQQEPVADSRSEVPRAVSPSRRTAQVQASVLAARENRLAAQLPPARPARDVGADDVEVTSAEKEVVEPPQPEPGSARALPTREGRVFAAPAEQVKDAKPDNAVKTPSKFTAAVAR